MALAKRLHENLYAYAGGGYTRHSVGAWGPLPVRRDTLSFFAALEFQPVEDLSFIAQTIFVSPVTDSLSELDRWSVDLQAFLRFSTGDWILSIGALENTDNRNNVDFGFAAGAERRF